MLSTCGLKITKQKVEVWYLILREYTFQELKEAAVMVLTEKEQFYPGDNIVAILGKEARSVRSMKYDRARAANQAVEKAKANARLVERNASKPTLEERRGWYEENKSKLVQMRKDAGVP